MDGNGMDTEAGRIDVVSCGIGFPKDAETLGLIGRADVVYGSRALLAACPVEARLTRIIGAKAREDAADALTLCRVGRHVVVLASGDALYHGFGGTLSGMAHPDDTIVYHPGITAFQALFHRLGLPWQDARLFSAHSGEALPARAIAEAPLSVAYAGSRYPAHAISHAVLKLHPASAGRAAVIAERLGSPEERLFSGPLADLARTECGPTSILLLLPTPWHCVPHTVARIAHDARPDSGIHEGSPISHSIPAPILTLGFPEEDYERENNLITASDVRAVILSRLRLPAWGTLWDIGAGSGSWGSKPPDCGPTSTSSASSANPNAARSSSVTAPVWAAPFIRSTSATPLNSSRPHPETAAFPLHTAELPPRSLPTSQKSWERKGKGK
ncbi:MAG: bifunctional cobalt-precorrin-7 (C(5))-methyltransferase CbiE/decarboxylating cobalt-precorrin-6B (C(15))-methyltransferase CbiT [Bilophila wadsworthia]